MAKQVAIEKSRPELSGTAKAVLAQGGGSLRAVTAPNVHLGASKAWFVVPVLAVVLLFAVASIYTRMRRPQSDLHVNLSAGDQVELKRHSGIWGVQRLKYKGRWPKLMVVETDQPSGSDLNYRCVDKNGWILNPDSPGRTYADINPIELTDIDDYSGAEYVAVSGKLGDGTVIARSRPIVYKIVRSGLFTDEAGKCFKLINDARPW